MRFSGINIVKSIKVALFVPSIVFIMTSSNKTLFLLRINALCFLLLDVSYSWNVTSLNLSDDILIWRFAVWKNRAFLAIPRSAYREKSGEYVPTLVEASWSDINSNWPIRTTNATIVPFFKNGSSKYNHRERTLVSVTGLDVDARGRLWVLDAPDQYDRWPRIVIYDLRRNDRLISLTELTDVSAKYLRTLIIDPIEDQWGSRGYIADADDETIVVYSLGLGKWWKLRMLRGPGIPRVHSTDLAISRRNSILYMTGHNTHDLFSINLEKIREDETLWPASHEVQNITVTWLGKKLGSSMGLICDLKDGLHYFMTSERASIRWDTKLPLNAESHSVLVQRNDVPCITDYIMDTRKNIWGLVNSKCPGARKKNISSSIKSRIIRVLKYPFAL